MPCQAVGGILQDLARRATRSSPKSCHACLNSPAWWQLNLKHIRTRTYSPRTNGKAERFNQSLLREWAYARTYLDSAQCADHLPRWLHHYNWHRPHASLDYQTPIHALNPPLNKVVGLHS